jgi:hypothetical protein
MRRPAEHGFVPRVAVAVDPYGHWTWQRSVGPACMSSSCRKAEAGEAAWAGAGSPVFLCLWRCALCLGWAHWQFAPEWEKFRGCRERRSMARLARAGYTPAAKPALHPCGPYSQWLVSCAVCEVDDADPDSQKSFLPLLRRMRACMRACMRLGRHVLAAFTAILHLLLLSARVGRGCGSIWKVGASSACAREVRRCFGVANRRGLRVQVARALGMGPDETGLGKQAMRGRRQLVLSRALTLGGV